ncbi:MAG: SGNH/GDSL hydrolase family protein [Phycisphaerae bacterium]|nr:SGNH/GDSL hydrolase family protein [Phycisphaerae bacterium]
MHRFVLPATIVSVLLSAAAHVSAGDFAVRDGDTVVFLGDSITAAGLYGRYVENYTLLRYPNRKVQFVNAGWGGDTAEGGLRRLPHDVFDRGATLLTVAYGINDIGWGTKADDEHVRRHLDAIRGIVEQCRKHKVRVFICSAAITAENPATAETGTLQKMGDQAMAISRELGEGAIDVQRTMRGIQKRILEANAQAKTDKEKVTLHAEDGVHLNDLGQLAMAFAILKGLGAPSRVSFVGIDCQGPRLLDAQGCKVEALTGGPTQVEFTRIDEGYPLNWAPFWPLMSYRWIPITEELNQYMLSIRGLSAGRYDVLADDRPLGFFPERELERGVNLCSATADGWHPGGPWDVQAGLLKAATAARWELFLAQRGANTYLATAPSLPALQTQLDRTMSELITLQRLMVQPKAIRFTIRPASEKPK